jgi:hypothetical protein
MMIRRPLPAEWNTSGLPAARRAYLDGNASFDEIAARIFSEAQVVRATVKPYNTPAPADPRNTRQIIFLVCIKKEICDLLYNAPDGLRGRYWQSPDHGFTATHQLIGTLLSSLLSFAEQNPPSRIGKITPMTDADIKSSLKAPSAKIWPRERDDDQVSLFVDSPLIVPRWCANEAHATVNKGMWRRTPNTGELEIKGALIGPDGTEYLPEGKRDRSCQIHRFGFT